MSALSLAAPVPKRLGLQVEGTKFMRNGREFRGIGLSHFSLAVNSFIDLGVGGIRSGAADMDDIKGNYGLPFVRLAFGGYDRYSWNYWYNNRALWYSKLDAIVAMAEAKGLGLIPVLMWDTRSFTDLSWSIYGTHEGPAKLAVAGSNVRGLFQTLVSEIVTRYKNSPAIWAWEIDNECFDNAGPSYYKFWAPDGSLNGPLGFTFDWGKQPNGSSNYTTADFLSAATFHDFNRWAVEMVKRADGMGRFVANGTAMGTSYGVTVQTTNASTADSLAQWNNAGDGLSWAATRDRTSDTIGIHVYPQNPGGLVFWAGAPETIGPIIARHKAWADQANKPFYLGEFGATYHGDPVDKYSTDLASEKANFAEALQAVVANDVRLSTVWNYDGNYGGASTWMKWPLNQPDRRYQLEAIAVANAKMAARN